MYRPRMEKGIPMAYTIAMHHHRFAAWAAARAAQRGLANSRIIIDALEGCGVKAVVDNPDDWPQTAGAFDVAHRNWCSVLLERLLAAGVSKATYGRAAKVIAIYLKSRIVLGGQQDSPFATVIHPPIDRILLQSLAGHLHARDRPLADHLRATTWTSLANDTYDDLIRRLRRAELDQPAFWCIERFWDPRGDEGSDEE